MTLINTALAAASFAAFVAAPAATQPALDANGDGNVTLDEVQAAYPSIGEDTFVALDTDEDGVLSMSEVEAATEAGFFSS